MSRRASKFWPLAACLVVAVSCPQPVLADDCDSLEVFDIKAKRNEMWNPTDPDKGGMGPRTVEALATLSEDARLLELTTRARVVECVSDHLRRQNLTPPDPSGTLPHSPGSSGILTDIDDAYDSMASADAAAKRFEKMGYTVKWDTANSFSVKELDYVGFSMEEPHFEPGSPEAEDALRRALRNEDSVKSIGGQEWVKGKVQPAGRIGELEAEQRSLAERLKKRDFSRTSEAAVREQMAKNQDEIAELTRRVETFRNPDLPGFTTDMMKKGAHHMNPAQWCPPQQFFDCHEQPRQAAKAAHRALSEVVDNPTPEQKALLGRLHKYNKKKRLFSPDEAIAAQEADALRADVRKAFRQANQEAARAAEALDKELIDAHRAARRTGDVEKLKEVEERLALRREAAKRRQWTVEELLANEHHVEDSQKLIHEWTTGERLRRVDVPGKRPVYQVIEETADGGTKVVKTLTEESVQRTAKNAIRRNMAKRFNTGLPAEVRPRFSSFADPTEPKHKVTALKEAVREAADAKAPTLSQFTKSQGALGMLGIGYAAYDGAGRAVDLIDRYTDLDPESWTGYGATVALGTVIGVADVVGLTVAETTHAIGQGIYGLAKRRELDMAQEQGREASKLGVLANMNFPALMAQFSKEAISSIVGWAKQKVIDIDAAYRAKLAANARQEALWARLVDGGFGQIIGNVGRLRALTDQLRRLWRVGSGQLDKAILGRDAMVARLGPAESPPDLSGRCQALVAGLGPSADRASIMAAQQQWSDAANPYRETLRKAALQAFETRAAAVTAEQILGRAGGLRRVQAEQAALQRDLQDRLAHLIAEAGSDSTLIALREEVVGHANPVPFDHSDTMVGAAREIRVEAEQSLLKLQRLDTAALPPCPFPNPDDLARLAGVTADGKAALAACNFADMRVKLAALEGAVAGGAAPSGEASETLAALRREIQADAAFESSRTAYFAADPSNYANKLGEAEAHLNSAKSTACAERQEAISNRLQKVGLLRGTFSSAEGALQSCDLAKLRQIRASLERHSHPGLKIARERLDRVAGPLASAVGHNDSSKPAYLSGKLDSARTSLRSALRSLDGIGAGACPAMRDQIAVRLQKIDQLRAKLASADRAIQSCRVSRIDAARSDLASHSHALLKRKVAALEQARKDCLQEARDAEEAERERQEAKRKREEEQRKRREAEAKRQAAAEAERKEESDKQRRQDAIKTANRLCQDEFPGSVVKSVKGRDYTCTCPDFLYWNLARKACVELAVLADELCADRRPGSRASENSTPEDIKCRCPDGRVWNSDRTGCISAPQTAKKKQPSGGSGSQSGSSGGQTGSSSSGLRQIAGTWRTQAFKHPGESWKEPQGYRIHVEVTGSSSGRVTSQWTGLQNKAKSITGQWTYDKGSRTFTVRWSDGEQLRYKLKSFNGSTAELVKLSDGMHVVFRR